MVDLGNVSWALPVAREAYENREEISNILDKFKLSLFGEQFSIAVTGLPGVGKTVLCDYLTGMAYKKGYTSPGRSEDVERKDMKKKKMGIRLSIIPGQESWKKQEGLDELFDGDSPVDGVIYVVANGFSDIRSVDTSDIQSLIQYTLVFRREEIDDLAEICERIRKSIRQNNKPSWMLIAVNKIDLYHNSIGEATDRYCNSQSLFTQRIQKLSSQVGSDRFGWYVLPVCSKLEDFKLGDKVYHSQFREREREYFIDQFGKKLELLCKAL